MVIVFVVLLLLVFVLRIVRTGFQKCKIPAKCEKKNPGFSEMRVQVRQAFDRGAYLRMDGGAHSRRSLGHDDERA